MKNVIKVFGLLFLLSFLGGCASITSDGTAVSNNQQKNDRSNLPDAPQP
ncbi:MAG: hypothetical protein NTU89_02195 [Candidatus Dependentiae bacterium]|nr:hypothetical protein [Candidatus Dependentiae bacterium]